MLVRVMNDHPLLCLGTVWVGRAGTGASARITLRHEEWAAPIRQANAHQRELIHVRAIAAQLRWLVPGRGLAQIRKARDVVRVLINGDFPRVPTTPVTGVLSAVAAAGPEVVQACSLGLTWRLPPRPVDAFELDEIELAVHEERSMKLTGNGLHIGVG
jgi:hypothetical protein